MSSHILATLCWTRILDCNTHRHILEVISRSNTACIGEVIYFIPMTPDDEATQAMYQQQQSHDVLMTDDDSMAVDTNEEEEVTAAYIYAFHTGMCAFFFFFFFSVDNDFLYMTLINHFAPGFLLFDRREC